MKGLDGVEPEVGLTTWAEAMSNLVSNATLVRCYTDDQWNGELDSRMAQIQALYDQLEPLWARLEVDQDQQDLFMEMNHGCGEAVIRAVCLALARLNRLS